MLKRVCDIFDAAEIDCSDYKVIETTCDQCVEIARQILHEQLEKRDPPQ
jgi:bacterioferritin-associated ferredoxin